LGVTDYPIDWANEEKYEFTIHTTPAVLLTSFDNNLSNNPYVHNEDENPKMPYMHLQLDRFGLKNGQNPTLWKH